MMYELTQMDARKIGRAEGRAEGREEGTNLMAKLISLLSDDGRVDDIIRIGKDEVFREAKMKEYGLE